MYLISITIKKDKIPEDKFQELLAGHRAWFGQEAKAGNFLLLGPYRDQKMAGVVVAQAASREALDEIISHDAFYPDMADYAVREFQANVISDDITKYRGK